MDKPCFPEEFKTDAVKHVDECGCPVVEVARCLSVSAHSLHKWLKRYDPKRAIPVESTNQ